MRLPRARFTVRRLLVAIAALAIIFGALAGLRRRAEILKRTSFLYSVEANRWEILLVDRSVTTAESGEILDMVHWHDDVAARYTRAASSPWWPIGPFPLKPPTPALRPELAKKYHQGRYPWPPY
jgi:hypothetical protein